MLSKRIIATLIAGSFAAAQAGAHSYLSDAAGSISDRGYEMQQSEPTLSEDSFPRYMTVFNPDGTSYSLVADAYSVGVEPALLVAMAEPMPAHFTVFDPDGTVTAYDVTSVDVAYVEPLFDTGMIAADESDATGLLALTGDMPVILVEVSEPIVVAIVDEGSTFGNPVAFDAEGARGSVREQMAAFDNALEATG